MYPVKSDEEKYFVNIQQNSAQKFNVQYFIACSIIIF